VSVQIARQHAVTALELDPSSDLAQHLMGRWHWEMAQLNGVVRFLVRTLCAMPCLQCLSRGPELCSHCCDAGGIAVPTLHGYGLPVFVLRLVALPSALHACTCVKAPI